MVKIDMGAFCIALGCLWGVCVFVLGLLSMKSHNRLKTVKLFAKVYIGYQATLLGSLIGALWGFIDGAISGLLIAWIYNIFVS